MSSPPKSPRTRRARPATRRSTPERGRIATAPPPRGCVDRAAADCRGRPQRLFRRGEDPFPIGIALSKHAPGGPRTRPARGRRDERDQALRIRMKPRPVPLGAQVQVRWLCRAHPQRIGVAGRHHGSIPPAFHNHTPVRHRQAASGDQARRRARRLDARVSPERQGRAGTAAVRSTRREDDAGWPCPRRLDPKPLPATLAAAARLDHAASRRFIAFDAHQNLELDPAGSGSPVSRASATQDVTLAPAGSVTS